MMVCVGRRIALNLHAREGKPSDFGAWRKLVTHLSGIGKRLRVQIPSLQCCKVAPCYVSVEDSTQKMKMTAENGMRIPEI